MELAEIQRLIGEGKYEVSFHAQQERQEENLDLTQIERAIVASGEILENYTNRCCADKTKQQTTFPSWCARVGNIEDRQ